MKLTETLGLKSNNVNFEEIQPVSENKGTIKSVFFLLDN